MKEKRRVPRLSLGPRPAFLIVVEFRPFGLTATPKIVRNSIEFDLNGLGARKVLGSEIYSITPLPRRVHL